MNPAYYSSLQSIIFGSAKYVPYSSPILIYQQLLLLTVLFALQILLKEKAPNTNYGNKKVNYYYLV